MKKNKEIKKASVYPAIIIACIACMLFITNTVQEPMLVEKNLTNQVIQVTNMPLGRGAPDVVTLFVEFFLLDYAETPDDVLTNNITYDGLANVTGYIDADAANITVNSEEYFYPVCVIAYNRTHLYDEDQWVFGRANVRLSFAMTDDNWMVGDETIDDVEGTRVEMSNDSAATFAYVAFYWDDGGDGYAFKDNAPGVDWNITVCADY